MTEVLLLLLAFAGMVIFVLVGVDLFSRGWAGYEEKWVRGAERTLSSMYITMPAQLLVYLSLASFVLLAILGLLLTGQLAVGLVLGLAAFFLPQGLVRALKKRRDRAFGAQLVDALGTMGNAMKAGLSLPQALEIVGQEMDNPIRQEFNLCCQEMRLGVTLGEALDHLHARMPNQDLALMNTAVGISQEVGGNLAEVFENISTTIRERNRIEQRIKALTAQGKMQGVILCLVPVGMGAVLTVLYPAMMAPLYGTAAGWAVIAVCAGLLATGAFFMARIIAIEV